MEITIKVVEENSGDFNFLEKRHLLREFIMNTFCKEKHVVINEDFHEGIVFTTHDINFDIGEIED